MEGQTYRKEVGYGNFNAIAAALTRIQAGNTDFQSKLNLLKRKQERRKELDHVKLTFLFPRRRRPREVAPELFS